MRPCIASPNKNNDAIEMKSSAPRIQRFWIMCPAPGISQPRAGASTAIGVIGVASAAFAISVVEFAILNRHNLALDFPCYFRRFRAHQYVYFAAHPKLRQINAGLDR